MQGRKVLVIGDDPELVSLLENAFSREGAEVYAARSGQDGLRQLYAHRPHLVVLDEAMLALDGWQTFARIRDFSDVPVIMLTDRASEREAHRGQQSGALHYVIKPLSLPLLLARARAVLRHPPEAAGSGKPIAYDDGYLRFELGRRRAWVNGELVNLTDTEYRLLAYLFQNAGRALTCRKILENVWGRRYQESAEYVHVYISRLRQKLEPDPGQPRYLRTERGGGYCFRKRVP